MKKTLRKRHRREKYFKSLGLASLCLALLFLGTIFGNILITGIPAFFRTEILAKAAPVGGL